MSDKITYPALFEYAGGVIGVSFPDLPGCVTSAPTEEEAIEEAREALIFHLEGMLDDGEEFPRASKLRDVRAGKDMVVVLIDGPRPDKLERVNFSTQASKLAMIDKLATAHGMTRSAWMVARSVETGAYAVGGTPRKGSGRKAG